MKRVVIIGCAGAGKSTLALELSRRLGLPLINLDRWGWQPGWVMTSREAFDEKLQELVSGEHWIIEGNYGRTQEVRMERADTIILLDFSGWLCVARVFKRALTTYGKVRSDLAPGCPEQLPDLQFLKWIWRFRSDSLPGVMARLEKHRAGRKVVILRSPREVRRFLGSDLEAMAS